MSNEVQYYICLAESSLYMSSGVQSYQVIDRCSQLPPASLRTSLLLSLSRNLEPAHRDTQHKHRKDPANPSQSFSLFSGSYWLILEEVCVCLLIKVDVVREQDN